ncbi:MAG TPA: DUF4147 domain-containing protein [Balneolaceae bacterium]
MNQKKMLTGLFLQALERCSPSKAVAEVITLDGNLCRIKDHSFNTGEKPVYILSVGKASVAMFNSAFQILGKNIAQSLVITPGADQANSCKADTVITASHPVPDEHSLQAGQAAINFLKNIPGDALLICLISGGTSSLMCLPAEGISIGDLHQTFELLNHCGASIHEINTVRKHCSQIKGGQMLRRLNPDITLIDLVISDIPDNDLSMIGSGPTTADSTTFLDTCNILLKHGIWEYIPASVQNHIGKGAAGEVEETLKPGDKPLQNHFSYIISSADKFAREIAALGKKEGFKTRIADEAYNDDVEKIASCIAGDVLSESSKMNKSAQELFIFYGESMVKVSGKGKGGRNQELALRGALKIAGTENITWLSAGTDGVDGPTDAAGAIVDGKTIEEARKKGVNPEEYLQQNNSYYFHEKMGTLLKTGPTGNNLMDVVLVMREE